MVTLERIVISEEQAADLQRLAARRGVAPEELAREAITHMLEIESAEYKRATAAIMALAGKYPNDLGVDDLARNHDKYLSDDWS